MGSGKTISLAGPSILFIYMMIGLMVYFVMRAMGELLLSNLNYKSFIDLSTDLIGPWAGYFVGWTYWLCWITTHNVAGSPVPDRLGSILIRSRVPDLL